MRGEIGIARGSSLEKKRMHTDLFGALRRN